MHRHRASRGLAGRPPHGCATYRTRVAAHKADGLPVPFSPAVMMWDRRHTAVMSLRTIGET